MSQRVLFSGYYGLGNAGDEAVLAASVGMFRARRPELSLTVLSGSPAQTRERLNVQAIPRMQPGAVFGQLGRTDLFLSGGGSLLQDATSLKSLLYYLLLLRMAQQRRIKTMVFAQGIGPLHRPAAQRLTAKVLSRVDAITVRDSDSADLLRRIGVSGPEIEVTADPVFALTPRVTDRVSSVAPTPPAFAVALRPWPGVEQILDPLAEALGRFEGEVALQAWPLFLEQDLPICEQLAARVPTMTVMRQSLDPAEWMALAGWTDAVVAMRLHGLIFAAARAVPIFGISYDPKVEALANRLRAPVVGTATSVDAAALRQGLEGIREEEDTRRRDREARAEHLRQAAERNVERALELLRG